MDRLSTDANILPCLRAVNPRLARAIEGAAENKPAKLFGFKASPTRQTSRRPRLQSEIAIYIAWRQHPSIESEALSTPGASRSRLQRTEAFALLRRRGSFNKL